MIRYQLDTESSSRTPKTILPTLLGTQGDFEIVVFGIVAILMLQWLPHGIWPAAKAEVSSGDSHTMRSSSDAVNLVFKLRDAPRHPNVRTHIVDDLLPAVASVDRHFKRRKVGPTAYVPVLQIEEADVFETLRKRLNRIR